MAMLCAVVGGLSAFYHDDLDIDRKDHPLSEAENVIFNSNNEVEKNGKKKTGKEELHGEFIGKIKLTRNGCEIF